MRCNLLVLSQAFHGRKTCVKLLITTALGAALFAGSAAAQDIKIALIYGKTGPLEAYAKQTETGLRMGFEYATKGTMAIDGRKIVLITKDDQTKPDVAKTALAEAYEDDKVDIAIGTTSSARRARDAARRRGAQEDPDRRAGGRRPDHRREVEPLHLPHRAQLVAGRDLECGGDRQAGRDGRDARRRTMRSGATASRRSRPRWPRPARRSRRKNTRR